MPRPKQVSSLEISQVFQTTTIIILILLTVIMITLIKIIKIKNFISIYYTNQLGLALATKIVDPGANPIETSMWDHSEKSYKNLLKDIKYT